MQILAAAQRNATLPTKFRYKFSLPLHHLRPKPKPRTRPRGAPPLIMFALNKLNPFPVKRFRPLSFCIALHRRTNSAAGFNFNSALELAPGAHYCDHDHDDLSERRLSRLCCGRRRARIAPLRSDCVVVDDDDNKLPLCACVSIRPLPVVWLKRKKERSQLFGYLWPRGRRLLSSARPASQTR